MNYNSGITSAQPPLVTFYYPFVTNLVFHKQSASNAQTFFVHQLDSRLQLRSPLVIPYRKEDGYFVATFNMSGMIIAVAEETYEQMTRDFQEQLKEAWNYYACEKDENLSAGAIQVKKYLQRQVLEV